MTIEGAGTPMQMGLDTTNFNAQIDAVVNRFRRYSQNVTAAAASTARFNETGQMTQVVINAQNAAGKTILVTMNRIIGGWDQETRVVLDSVDKQIRAMARRDAAAARTAENTRRDTEVAAFRPRLSQEERTLPRTADRIDRRFFYNAQRDLERFVASGGVTATRANGILDAIQNGTSHRLQGIEENFRVAALRMFAQQRNLIRAATQATAVAGRTQDSTQVPNVMNQLFGNLNPAASAAMVSSVRGTMNQLANVVQNGGVTFTRFQEVVRGALLGMVNPANKAEREVVKMVLEMQRQYTAASAAADKLTESQQRQAAATQLGASLRARMGSQYTGLASQDRERVDAQINRLESLRARANNPLTGAGATRAIDAGLSGASGAGFTGVEAQARKAAARIRAILRQELKDPFQISLAIAQNFNLFKSLYTGQFLTRLVREFEQVVSAAASYQRSIALIQTITDNVKVPFEAWSESIRRVSDELGKPIADVAAAGYDVLSNQVTQYVEDTQSVLRTAGQFATVTNSTVEDSVNLISSAINTFKLSSNDAERVAAQFFTTIDLGRVKTNEMANTIGRSAVFAKTLGVSLEELQAGIITITQTGQKADSSFTLLNNVFQKLLNPTKELQGYYDRLGVSTGDVFVKTFGFTGALRMLQKETQGSASKLSDFFNEIRAFGGIDALISRADVFQDALKQLGNSSQSLDAAKKKFEDLPGQKFIIEMNKLKNLFLTTFQTNILTSIVSITQRMGGLANVVKNLTYAAFTLGVSLGVAFGLSKLNTFINSIEVARNAMARLTFLTATYSTTASLAFIGVGVALGALAIALYNQQQKSLQFYDKLKEASDRSAEAQIDANNKASAARQKVFVDGLKGQQYVLLQNLSLNKQILQERLADEEKASKKIAASLKNAFENGYGTARNILDELKNKQKELLKSAADFEKKDRNEIVAKFRGDQFRRNLKENEAEGGGTRQEAQIYEKRIRELNQIAIKAAKRQDREGMRKALDEKDELAGELGDKSRENRKDARAQGAEPHGDFDFAAGNQFALKSTQFRLTLEKMITAEQKKQGIALQAPINKMSDKLKELEDAQTELSKFKLTDDSGKPIDASKEDSIKRLVGLRNEVVKLIHEITKAAGPNDKLMQRDLFSKQNELAIKKASEFRQSIEKNFDAQGLLKEQGDLINSAINKLGDDGAARMEVAEKKFTEAGNLIVKSVKDTQTQLKNVFGRALFPDEAFRAPDAKKLRAREGKTTDNVRRVELQDEINSAIKTKDYDLAIRKIDELNKLLEKNKLLTKTVPEAGGGQVAIGVVLGKARENLERAKAAQGQQKEAKQQINDAAGLAAKMATTIGQLNADYTALGSTDEQVTKKLISNQDLFAKALARSREAVKALEADITNMGPKQNEFDQAAANRRREDIKPNAAIAPRGFEPQVRKLNQFEDRPRLEGPPSPPPGVVDFNVTVVAPPKQEDLGKDIANRVIRELRRDPQVLEKAK